MSPAAASLAAALLTAAALLLVVSVARGWQSPHEERWAVAREERR